MLLPHHRVPIRLARGDYASLEAAKNAQELKEGEAAYARDQDALYVVENVGGSLQLIKIGGTGGAAPVTGAASVQVLQELPGQPGVLQAPPPPNSEGDLLFNPQTHVLQVAVFDHTAPPGPGGAVPLVWTDPPSAVKVQGGPPMALPTAEGQMVFDRDAAILHVAAALPPVPGMPRFVWVATGGSGVKVADTAPPVPGMSGIGQLWFSPQTNSLSIALENPAGSGTVQWLPASAAPPNGVFINPTPPPGQHVAGTLWFDDSVGELFIWYDDGTTQQWVSTNAIGSQSNPVADAKVFIGPTPPPVAEVGKLWFDDVSATMFVRYDDGTSAEWVSTSAVGGGIKPSSPVHIGDTPPPHVPIGSLWWNSNTGVLYVLYDDGSNTPAWVAAEPATQPNQPTRGVTQNVSLGGVTLHIADGVITSVT